MNDIYELLNNAQVDLSEFDETPLNDIDKKRFKDKLRKDIKSGRKTFVKAITATAVALSIVAVTAFASYKVDPTFATGIPVVGDIIKNITGYGNEEFDKYTSVINKTVKDKGIKVTLKEIMLDDNQLRIAITIKSDINNNYRYFCPLFAPRIIINDEILDSNGASGTGEKINDNTFVWVNTIQVQNLKMPSNVNMKIIYEEFNFSLENEKSKTIQGKWEFNTSVSKQQIESKTRKIKVNKNIIGKEVSMHIKDIIMTPLTTNINYKFKGEKPLGFIIEDDKGKIIREESLGWSSPGGLLAYINNYKKGNINLSSVSKDAKKLTITPFNDYSNPLSKEYEKTKPIRWSGNSPITLKQNDENKIIVYKIEKKDGKLYVHYKTQGVSYEIQKYKLYLYDSDKKPLDCIYEEGNLLKLKNKNEMIIAVFKANNKEDIYLGTDNMKDMDVIKGEEFTVDLEKN